MNAYQIEQKYGITRQNAKISDILWLAANVYLRSSWDGDGVMASCHAVEEVCDELQICSGSCLEGLREMGLNTRDYNFFEFDNCDNTRTRQQVRYAWLMFAYEIALEQGV